MPAARDGDAPRPAAGTIHQTPLHPRKGRPPPLPLSPGGRGAGDAKPEAPPRGGPVAEGMREFESPAGGPHLPLWVPRTTLALGISFPLPGSVEAGKGRPRPSRGPPPTGTVKGRVG